MSKPDYWRPRYKGSSVFYMVDPSNEHVEFTTGDYWIDTLADTYAEDLPGRHLVRTGRRIKSLPKRAIAHDVFALIRPTMRKDDAIRALERIIDSIRESGLYLGAPPQHDCMFDGGKADKKKR